MEKFSLKPVPEVHLRSAPLAKVLMQVMFSRTPHLTSDSADEQLAETLGRYPVRRRQMVSAPTVVVNGMQVPLPFASSTILPTSVLTYSEPTGAWQVSLTDTAVALETTNYDSRDDFCDRALEVFRAVAAIALPPVVDRVGLRYIDRLSGKALERVPDYVIPELRALKDCVVPNLVVQHSATDSILEISATERLQVRSGLLPAGGGFDPSLQPLPVASWLLDMDMYTAAAGFPFDPDKLADRLRNYAEIIYAFFRFATSDIFEKDHIGEEASIGDDFR
jgi:uncharacterized protein (TIGR04255 family)